MVGQVPSECEDVAGLVPVRGTGPLTRPHMGHLCTCPLQGTEKMEEERAGEKALPGSPYWGLRPQLVLPAELCARTLPFLGTFLKMNF